MIAAFITIKFGIVQSLLLNLRKKTVFEECLTQKHRFLFVHFDEYESGIYFNEVWNCPEYSVDSKTKTVFEEHLTQKHHFLFVYFDEYECGIYFNKVWNCPECSVDS